MDHENFWNQRRNVLGYWRSGAEKPARLRLRVLHNGRDFVSAAACNTQVENRVLTAFHFVRGGGDYHPYFDRPAHGTFHTHDLRIRYEVEGPGIRVSQLASDLFELAVGDMKAVIRTGPLRFDGKPASGWILGGEGEAGWLDGVFYQGPERDFHPGEVGDSTSAAAVELIGRGEESAPEPIKESADNDDWVFRWNGLETKAPLVVPSVQ